MLMQMRDIKTVMIEVIVIGIISLVFNLFIFKGFTGKFPPIDKNHQNMLIGSFLLGALIHLSFEYTGTNEWWCKSTYKIV